MSWTEWAVWGLAATIVLTTLMSASQRLGFTRMNIPYVLGTMVTPNRDRAKVWGIVFHLANGWLFSLIYVAVFHAYGSASWWLGALVGIAHSIFVLAVALPSMPGIHPRMASETRGPEIVEQLEPPGFFGLNYGVPTPVSVVAAHIVFGVMLGALYGGV